MSYDPRAKADWLKYAAAVLKSNDAFPAFLEASAALEAHIGDSVGALPKGGRLTSGYISARGRGWCSMPTLSSPSKRSFRC